MFTKFAYICFILVLYFFDPYYLISYLTLILFLVILSYSKFYDEYLLGLFKNTFFRDECKHPLLRAPNGIELQADVNFHNLVKQMGQDNHEELEEIEEQKFVLN